MNKYEIRDLLCIEGTRIIKGPFGTIKAPIVFFNDDWSSLIVAFKQSDNKYLTISWDLVESFKVIPNHTNKKFNMKSYYDEKVIIYAKNEENAEYLKHLYFE